MCALVRACVRVCVFLFLPTHWMPSLLRWLREKPSLVRALSTMAGYTTYFSKHSRPTYSRSNHISTASSGGSRDPEHH